MPQAAAALIAWAGGTAFTGSYIAVAFEVATVAYGAYNANQQRKALAKASLFEGQNVTVTDSAAAKWFAYGRAAPASGILHHWIHAADTNYYTIVFDVCHHEIDGFEDVLANDVSIGALGGGIWGGATLTEGLVQPGSKFYKSHTETRSETITWPVNGASVTLGATVERVLSASSIDSGGTETGQVVHRPLEGVDFEVQTHNKIKALNATYAGEQIIVTYVATVGEPLMRVRFFKGLPAGERDLISEAESAGAVNGPWTEDMKGQNVARMAITMRWDADIYGAIGLPTFRAVFRAKKVRDWVSDTVTWSSNFQRCVLDYVTDPMFGFGSDVSEIDVVAAVAGQNASAENVPIKGGEFQERYTIDGSLSSEQSLFDNLRTMLSSGVGSACYSAGKWIVSPSVYKIPALTLTDSDFALSEKTSTPFTPGRENYNCVSGRFTNPATGYKADGFIPYESATYIAQDGGEKVFKELDFPLCIDGTRAQRLAKQSLFTEVRNTARYTAGYTLKAWPLQPTDGVYLKHTRRGWNTMNGGLGKAWKVMGREVSPDMRVILALQEDAAAFHAWDFNEATEPDPAPNVALHDPTYINAPTGVRVNTSAVTFEVKGGQVVPYCSVTWDPITDRSTAYVAVHYKRAGDTEFVRASAPADATEFRIAPVGAGDWLNVVVFAVSHIGAESKPKAYITHVCSADLPVFGQPAQSANWITNSLFRSGVVGWTLFKNGAARASFFKPLLADQWLGGSFDASPANGVLYNPDPFPIGASPPQLMTNPAPVTPGQGVGAMMSVLPVQCDASIGLLFLDANSAATGYFVADDVVVDHLPGTRTDARARTNYDTTRVWAEAPANSVAVRAFLTMTGPLRGTPECAVYITEPLLGPCLQADLAALKWTPGGQGSVGTAVMEVNATNIMYRPQTAIPNAVTTTTSEVSDILMRFTPSEDGQIEVVYECECASQTINGEYTLVAGFSITGVSEAVGAPVIVSAPVLTTPATANQLAEPKGMTRKATFTAVNGQEIVITHYMQRVVTVEYASSKLGIAYTPTSGKRFNGKDAFSDRRLSALLMPKTTAILAAA